MARVLLLLWFWLWGAGMALAADTPAEAPPDGFSARQYVDSTGCVFLRSGAGWAPRRDSAGAPICGYPPTPLSLHQARPLPTSVADAPPVPMPGMSAVEARLLAAVTGEMRPGEFVGAAGDASRSLAPAAEPSRPADLGQQIAIASVAGPALDHTASAALHPDTRLCALIGAGDPAGAARLGHDPTRGFCAGDLIALPQSTGPARPEVQAPARLAAHHPVPPAAMASGKPADNRQVKRVVKVPARSEPSGKRRADAPMANRTGRKTVARARPAPAAAPSAAAAMIPAGARWLEVGSFADPLAAEATLGRLRAAGFPAACAARRGGATAALAGPYATRQAIVRAYDRLRAAGYGPLRPR